jgi:hypothetical protein
MRSGASALGGRSGGDMEFSLKESAREGPGH